MVYHRVHVARGNEEAKARLAEDCNALRVAPVGLGDDAHRVAEGHEHPRDDGGAKGGVVHVGVARHIHEVKLLDAAVLEVLRGRGQELAAVGQRRGGGLLGCFAGLEAPADLGPRLACPRLRPGCSEGLGVPPDLGPTWPES